MRIAVLHNRQISDDPGQTVFTAPQTLDSIMTALTDAGCDPVPVEASRPVRDTVDDLDSAGADLVFNLAEGSGGPLRQSFFTELLTQLGLPFTGSGPRAQAVALDKHLAKLVAQRAGVLTPGWAFVRPNDDVVLSRLDFPCILKPNFEGTSRGVFAENVVESPAEAQSKLRDLLKDFPDGILVEQYIAGRDVTVPYLGGLAGHPDGVLVASEVEVTDTRGQRVDRILDYSVKNAVMGAHTPGNYFARDITPAALPDDLVTQLREATRLVVDTVGCLDVARIDYRIDTRGRMYFLEINALPGLAPDLSIHRAAELAGADSDGGVIKAIVASATARYEL